MCSRISFAQLTEDKIGQLVELRGQIVSIKDGSFQLSEISLSQCTPASIICIYPQQVDQGFVSVQGKLQCTRDNHSGRVNIFFEVQTLGYISSIDAYIEEPNNLSTYFTYDNLCLLQLPTAFQMFQILNQHAMEEGFRLTHKKSLSENSICFRCQHHSCYGKDPNLNSDCQFKVCIYKKRDTNLYHVTSYYSVHNHFIQPGIFAHVTLQAQIKEMIFSLMKANTPFQNIMTAVKDATGISLSSYQLRNICKSSKVSTTSTESEELINYVNSNKGLAIPIETPDEDGIIHRHGVATFNEIELNNLDKFGDFIALDPTFTPMISDWSIIPITVVNNERRIKSGGLILTSTNSSDTFKVILKLLTTVLPCKDKLCTICSDDDTGLDAAFQQLIESTVPEEQEAREKVSLLRRVICFWHKSSNFVKFLQNLDIPQDIKTRCIDIFHQIGTSREETNVATCIEMLRQVHDSIAQYMDTHIIPKMQNISKVGLKDTFTCGYISSSIAESTNNRIKSYISGRALTLTEMRIALDNIIANDSTNDQYVKAVKPHKMKDPLVLDMIVSFNVSPRIAEAIAGSIRKTERLALQKLNDHYIITEEIKDKDGQVLRIENFTVKDGHCSCFKYEQSGLPCSHIIKVYQLEEIPISNLPINQRWILGDQVNFQHFDINAEALKGTINITDDRSPSEQIQTSTGRYVTALSLGQEIATLASKNKKLFDIAVTRLKEILQSCKGYSANPVVDDLGTRPGRRKKNRKKLGIIKNIFLFF